MTSNTIYITVYGDVDTTILQNTLHGSGRRNFNGRNACRSITRLAHRGYFPSRIDSDWFFIISRMRCKFEEEFIGGILHSLTLNNAQEQCMHDKACCSGGQE